MAATESAVEKHTPGPWQVETSLGGHRVITGPDGAHTLARVCASFDGAGGLSSLEANARLMAAAPDLLTFVRYIVAVYDQQVADIKRPGDQRDVTRLAGTIGGCHLNVGVNVEAVIEKMRTLLAKIDQTCTCVEPPNHANGFTHDADCPRRFERKAAV